MHGFTHDDTSTCDAACEGCKIDRPIIGLDDWAEHLCHYLGSPSRWHFWQIAQDPLACIPLSEDEPMPEPWIAYNPRNICHDLTFKHSGAAGNSTVGRDEIWRAIRTASYAFMQSFHKYAGYYPVPVQEAYEANAIELLTPDLRNLADIFGIRGHKCDGYKMRLPCDKLLQLGREREDYVVTAEIDPNIDITDEDGDGILDTVTIAVPILGQWSSPDEVRAFFDEADTVSDDLYRNELRPIKVVDDGLGSYIITIPTRLAVKPTRYIGYDCEALDPNDRDIYATSYRLSRHWVDESQAITIMRRASGGCGCSCGCSGGGLGDCYTCSQGNACIVNSALGIIEIQPTDSNEHCQACVKCIDRICINYMSGGCLDVDYVVARFAASLLRHKPCCRDHGCMDEAQQDFVIVHESSHGHVKMLNSLTNSEKLLTSAFGTRRGGVEALRYVMMHGGEQRMVGFI